MQTYTAVEISRFYPGCRVRVEWTDGSLIALMHLEGWAIARKDDPTPWKKTRLSPPTFVTVEKKDRMRIKIGG